MDDPGGGAPAAHLDGDGHRGHCAVRCDVRPGLHSDHLRPDPGALPGLHRQRPDGACQLYFLLGGLLDRLVYLSHGLALILAFIGIKLIAQAAHDSFPNVPQIPLWLSLTVIVTVLATTTIASLAASRRTRRQDTDGPASGIQPSAQPVP
jgi:hypothetical protein